MRDHLHLDPGAVAAIAEICRCVQPPDEGLTAKNKERLAIFKDKRRLRELVQVPSG